MQAQRIPSRVRIAITTPDGEILDDSLCQSLFAQEVRDYGDVLPSEAEALGRSVIASLRRVQRLAEADQC